MPNYRPQQPTTRNRRVTTIAQPADRLQIQWTLARESAHRVSIELRLPTTGAEAPYPDLVIQGTPALRVNDTLPTWTIVDRTPVSFAMECPEELPEAGQWLLAPYDPAIRSSLGGYLLPKLQDITVTPPVTFAAASRVSDHDVQLTFADVAGVILTSPIGHAWTPLGIPTTQPSGFGAVEFYAVAPAQALATFVEDISGESSIVLAASAVVDSTGRVFAGGELPFS